MKSEIEVKKVKENICAMIVSYNCDEKILLVIDSIINQVDSIILIDNGSKSDSLEILKKLNNDKIQIIYNSNNMGIAYALNQGVKYAQNKKFQWVLTLDQDSMAAKDMITNMLKFYYSLDNSQKAEVVSIVPVHIEQKTYNEKQNIKNNNKFQEVLTEITSGNLLNISIFDKIGYFEEKLFIDCVDHDFCFRICKSGHKIIKVYDAILLHNLGDITTKKIFSKKVIYSNHSVIRRYYITRNRFYIWNLYEKNFTEWVKVDKKANLMDLIMIILFEKDKLLKLKMIIKGYIDYRKKHFGELKL